MSFNILATTFFEKELKKLAKKYPSLKKDVDALARQLEEQPKSGTPIGMTATKSEWRFLRKEKVNQEEQG